jgi:hypothetical protein
MVVAGNGSGWTTGGKFVYDSASVGQYYHDTLVSGIIATENNLVVMNRNLQWHWPGIDGTAGRNQSLTTDGYGNLSWSNGNETSGSIFTPSSGDTITAVWGSNIVKPSAGIGALTIALPSSPVDNETVYFTFTNSITSLSFIYGGATVTGTMTSVSITNGNVKYWLTYNGGSWY